MMNKIFLSILLIIFCISIPGNTINDSLRIKKDSIYTKYLSVYNSIKLSKGDADSIAFKQLENCRIAFIVEDELKVWKDLIWRYQQIPIFHYSEVNDSLLKGIDHCVFAVKSQAYLDDLLKLKLRLPLTVVALGDSLDYGRALDDINIKTIFSIADTTNLAKDLAVQLLFDGIRLCNNENQTIPQGSRLSYLPAQHNQLCESKLSNQVDSVVENAIKVKAFPGCRVFVAYKGNVIFNKAYGYHTYDERIKVQHQDVYDLASVTKIAGPLPLIMKACDNQLMDLDQSFSRYWKDWKKRLFHRSNKNDITVREVLAHQARLQPYINYYPSLMKNDVYDDRYFSFNPDEKHALKISDNLYLKNRFKKEVYKQIRKSDLLPEAKYKYSGLSYMIYPQLLSGLFEQPYEALLYEQFFKPLGASSLCYNPLDKVAPARIVPTEYDHKFRKTQIKGYVHDEAAAVMGGVSGNAGLFGSADDLAKLMQMYLQKGEYGHRRYLSEEIINEFTRVQFPDNDNRRGAGFDKPLFGNDTLSIQDSYPAPEVSSVSYGHSGFTGTFVWMDPKYELLFIFLSNRVYPTRENPLIYRMNVRPTIQQIFYKAILELESSD